MAGTVYGMIFYLRGAVPFNTMPLADGREAINGNR
jgi:hypothetical protein